MKTLSPDIYTEQYYLSICLGAEEFTKSGGKELHPRLKELLSQINISKQMKVLDIGCGRGDISLYLAKKAQGVTGIDYSRHAIKIAKNAKKKFPRNIQKKTKFYMMNAKRMAFQDNYFDAVFCIDVFEHLYPKELEAVLQEIKRVLKPNGLLFVHTGTNRILYDYTYKYYILPINKLITWIDQTIKKTLYSRLPDDPRTKIEKQQHVNEPTYYYLLHIFKKYNFSGKINAEVGYIKPIRGLKTRIYNALIALYPLSKYYPLNLLFGWVFICSMKNNK